MRQFIVLALACASALCAVVLLTSSSATVVRLRYFLSLEEFQKNISRQTSFLDPQPGQGDAILQSNDYGKATEPLQVLQCFVTTCMGANMCCRDTCSCRK
eukprot:2143661-Amphidinium_carterae.1